MSIAYSLKPNQTARSVLNATSGVKDKNTSATAESNIGGNAPTPEKEQNKGDFRGGVGYFFEKLAVGTVQSVEGIWDYTAGGIAKFFGADEWAERQFANNWFGDWYSHPDEWYNPGETMQFVGDIAGGIGSSLPSIALSFVPGAGATLSIGSAVLGAAGNATTEAYRETGELTGKEFGYGALSGATEGLIEKITAGFGVGTGRIIKNATKKSAKEITESISKTMLKKVGGLGLDFASEAIEEGFAEFVSPYYQRFTYNPDAENATAEEILYAAIVGGFSGLITSGAESGFRTVYKVHRGNKLDTEGRTQGVIELSERLAAYEDEKKTGDSTYEKISKTVKALKSSLEKTDGKIKTVHQKNMLATLEANNTLAPVKPLILRSAANVVADAEGYARRFNEAQYTDENGNKLQYTVEDILKDVDLNNKRSLSPALETNKALRDIAVSQATGKILINARNYAAQVMSSEQQFANDNDLTRFLESAPAELLNSVSSALGIEDWNNVTVNQVNEKLSQYKTTEAYRTAKSRTDAFEAAKNSPAKRNIPLRPNFAEGVSRYNDGKANIGILKENGNRIIHDYDAGTTTRPLSYKEATEALKAYTAAEQSSTRAAVSQTKIETVNSELTDITSPYSVDESSSIKRHLKNEIATSFNDIINFVSSPKESAGKRLFLGKIKPKTASKIKSDTNVTTYGKSLVLSGDDIIHIFEQHGNPREHLRGQEVITPSNFNEILKAIIEPDTVKAETDNNNVISLIFEKTDGNKVTAVTIVSEKKKALTLKSARITKKRQHISSSSDVQAPNPTPVAVGSMNTVSKSSIPNSTQKVNSSAEENSSKINKYAEAAKEADALAKEKVKGYSALSAEDQATVRRIIRQAKANGLSEADTLLLARVSAHSRLNIEINEKACTREQKQEDGTTRTETVDGLYDINAKKIYINPKAKRNSTRILGHEAFHAIYNTLIKVKGGDRILTKAVRAAAKQLDKKMSNTVSEDGKRLTKAQRITYDYRNEGVAVIFEEYAAHYAEYFTDNTFMSALVGEQPSIKEKILSFFTKAEADYADDSRLSLAARRYKNLYKKMFAALSQVNKYDLTSLNQKKLQVTGDNDEDTRAAINLDNSQKSAYNLGQENKSKNGDSINEQNSQDTDLLAKRQVSTVGRDEDRIRELGASSEKIYRRLVVNQYNSGGDSSGRTGTSGFLTRRRISLLRYRESILRDLRGKRLKTKDTAGRTLPQTVFDNFKNTVFKDENGQLLSVFHWTHESFKKFAKGDIGFHFGTLNAAHKRNMDILDNKKKNPQNSIYKECYLNIENPILIDYDPITWDTFATSYKLNQQGIIDNTELEHLKSLAGYQHSQYNSEAATKLRQVLSDKGYDGIIYSNGNEGDLSVIAFNADQIYTVAENGIDVSESGKRFAKPLEDTSIGYISTAYSKQEYDNVREVVNSAKKATVRGASSFIQQMQVLFVNEQAGIENAGKKLGIKDIEAKVEQMRVARNKAQTMLGDVQYITVNGKWKKVGKGFARIIESIKAKGETYFNNFQMLLFHRHNVDRMSLHERSVKKNNDRIAEVERLKRRNEEIELDLTVANGVLNAYKYKRSAEAYAQRQKANDEIKALKAEQRANKHAINSLASQIEHFVPEENKPVFGKEVNGEMKAITAEESSAEVERLLQEHPEFEGYAKEIHVFLDNLMKQNVASGRISESLYLELKDKYPHYVPTMRELQNQGNKGVSGKFNIKVKSAVRGAKGGFAELQPIDISIPRMVEEVMNACAANDVAKALGKAAEASGDNDYVSFDSRKKLSAEEALQTVEGAKEDAKLAQATQKSNQITYYENGEQVTLNVTKDIFAGFDAFNSKAYENVLPVVAATKVNNLFKKLVTSANPFFLVRNALRDIQDAGINTKYGKKFVKNYFKAMKLISANSEYWQLYRAAGGLNSSVFEYDKGYTGRVTKRGLSASENKVLSFFGSVERANVIIEQLPRFAEFVSSIEAGNSVEQAVLDAADVTTNFGRTGKVTKILNKTAFPFLNPAIQGLSKIWRNIAPILDFSHPRIAVKALLNLAVKAAIVGIIPQMLNQLLLGDDEEYQELRDSDKENNYIFRTGDTFFKLPKGRVAAVLAGLTNRTVQEINGQSADWKDYLDSVISNVTPVENFSRPIWQPITDAKNNTTWYGSSIEGQQFENTRPEDRYDEHTSSIAIGIGKACGWSPKKVHYVIDQYSGVIGDFILPLTTQKAERNIISANFVIDPVSSNRLSDDFYKLYEEAQYLKTDGDVAALYKVKYLNSVKSAVSQMYDEKAAVQRSELSNGEKLQKTRVIQALINEAYRNAVNCYEAYSGAIAETQGYFDDSTEQGQKLRYTEITRINFGAERALKEYNTEVYQKAQSLYKAGIDYDTYYSYYFATKGLTSDKDKNGKTISGSKRAKVLSAINALGVSTEKKMLLLCSRGYSLKDGDFGIRNIETAKKRLLRYILALPLTRVQKAELAEACGFTVNGYKISLK